MSLWWKLGGAAIILALGFIMLKSYGTARYSEGVKDQRLADAAETRKADAKVSETNLANERRQSAALVNQAERYAAREPIILRSTNTVRDYAQTVAGRVLCLDAGRVLGIEGDRAALFAGYPPSAGESARAVPANAH